MVTEKIELHDKASATDSVTFRGRTEMADIYIKEAEKQAIRARKGYEISMTVEGDERSRALWNEKQGSLFTILLSVFALEAHINRIGHDNLSKTEWENRERNSLKRKWFEFPKLISGNSFDKITPLFKNFQQIIGLRNYLVHYKDYDYKEFVEHPCGTQISGIYEHVNVENAELAYNTANDMMKKLNDILKK